MNKFTQTLIGIAIALFGLGSIVGAAMGVSLNPLTWLSFFVCAISGGLLAWYGWAIAIGMDWK